MKSPDNPKQQSFDLEPPSRAVETNTTSSLSSEVMDSEPLSEKAEETALSSEEMNPALISDEASKSENNPVELSSKETREVVTPYAVAVSPDLLGQPLATPSRRAVAILIDVLLISILSLLGALVFAGFVALTLFRAGNRLKQQKRLNVIRLSLRGATALLIFFIIFTGVSNLSEPNLLLKVPTAQQPDNKESMESLLDLAEKLIHVSCEGDSECLQKYAEGVAIGAAAMDIPVEDINATTSDLIAQKEWRDESKSLFMDTFINTLSEERNAYTDDVLEITQSNEDGVQSDTIYSAIAWVKGIMSDLGLSLGWAALYFTVFTAWWRGQTIGKKIMGIEVVKLNGNYPSLWESFGRYGGYAAGLATGLLGFLQIYWDPNRQTIQDKISETLVLRLKRN